MSETRFDEVLAVLAAWMESWDEEPYACEAEIVTRAVRAQRETPATVRISGVSEDS